MSENIYVPGLWKCAKCDFRLVQSNLNVADGTVTARDQPGDTCPNCDSPLWRVSWKDEAEENMRIAETQMDRALKAEADRDTFDERMKAAEAANELDRTRIATALTALNSAVRGLQWVLEGRGPYEWDDDDYRAEFNLWVDDVQAAANLFAEIARDWHGCPLDPTEIRHARAMLGPDSKRGSDDRSAKTNSPA